MKGHVTQFSKYLSKYNSEPDPVKLNVKMKRLIKGFDNFENIQNAIELLDNDQSEERENVEELYDDLITAAEKILNAGTSISENCSSPATTTDASNSKVRLPKIELPTFDRRLEH